ncbi:bifunctional glycosyltransferase/CDP-glycerol:glycerophosphate glycerophosphotransferase [Hominibacterium faecale]|uniref:bifunctional glycosyltransferase/CDP-glycerol:glycerophosphate glycerophosphotransferase n=1 Tax=Hominibacterium faecale TaxID=2839743 RepID=UPI0022B298E9|nr:CDP-glycerol glycerophosphotransferase family protein [Hominibacterium faecale]
MNTTEKYYTFSVIMPLYNVENFFEEAIESVIQQTIGFEEHIQIILVNDGSPDNVETMCFKYKDRYPQNIVYVRKENGGVSSARNEGIPYASGKYVNFFDADDRWALDAFEKVLDFLEGEAVGINALSCRYCFFGKKEGFTHPLDFKYSKRQIIDINQNPDNVQMAVNTVFFKKEALKDVRFDTRLKVSEDSIFFAQVMLEQGKYGILPDAVYYYRKRMSGDSAIDVSTNNKSWYMNTPEFCYKAVFEYSKAKFGQVIPYVQHMVMYDLQWRLKPEMSKKLTADEKRDYIQALIDLLQEIEDSVIVSQKNINFIFKLFALKLKYGRNIAHELEVRDGAAWSKDVKLFQIRQKNKFQINLLYIENETLYLEGRTELDVLSKNYQIVCSKNNKTIYPVELYPIAYKDVKGFTGERIFEGKGFKIRVPLKEMRGGERIDFALIDKNGAQESKKKERLKPSFGQFAKLEQGVPLYYCSGDYLVKQSKDQILVLKNSWKRRMLAEGRLAKELIKKKKYDIFGIRIRYHLSKLFTRDRIWICSDRTDMARDNGEHLFRYLNGIEMPKERQFYFVLDKQSIDFDRMNKTGPVLELGSKKYKQKFLLADKIISAHADPWVYNAFGDDSKYVKDLYNFDFVFLQHGIIKDDFSSWLHKQNKNIKLFITSSERERDSIANGDYGYDEKTVVLTGLPRFDALNSDPKKQILIFPTWRKELAPPLIQGSSEREYLKNFKETDYYQFYNSLINDPRLLAAMKETGYRGQFYVHPAFKKQADDFQGNERITVIAEIADYTKMFNENALLVTDYSSVYFDFAYMKKPVVHAMFDYERYYQMHTCKRGYFDYQADGFGPICYDLESTVKAIIDSLESGCKMEQMYTDRVDQFFAWTDKNNCKRVYEAINSMMEMK